MTNGITATIPTNQLKFALTLQKYLLDDPIDGDYKMQRHFTNFLVSSLEQTDRYGRFISPDEIYPDKKTLKEANLQANATYSDLHQAGWATICPTNTCGSFIFHISSDENVDAFLSMNNNHYQAGLAPFLNETFTDTNVITKQIFYECNSGGENYNVSTGKCSSKQQTYHSTIQKRQMCENTIYNSVVMDSFIKTPPTALREPFFECSPTAKAAVMNSCGNAAAIAGILSVLAMLLFGYFFRRIHNHRAKLLSKEEDAVVTLKYKGKSDEIDYEKLVADISDTVKKVVKAMKLLQEKQNALKETLSVNTDRDETMIPSEWGSPVCSSPKRSPPKKFVTFQRKRFLNINNDKRNRIAQTKKVRKGNDLVLTENKEGESEYSLTDCQFFVLPEDIYHDIESPTPFKKEPI